jgi:hypothetical protein
MSKEEKIRALSLKTRANGASEAEEEAAKRMIERLQSPSLHIKKIEYDNLEITEVDWDAVAEQSLDHIRHSEYVNDTHAVWVRYNMTRNRLEQKHPPMSRNEYRTICYNAFRRLSDQKLLPKENKR